MTESIIEAMISEFAPYEFDGTEMGLRYRLHLPRVLAPGRKYTLAVVIHGAGSIGDNNLAQLRLTGLFCRNKAVDMEDIIVLAPQCPAGHLWIDNQGTWDGRTFYFKEKPAPALGAMMELIQKIVAEYPVDMSRILVGGASMGGYATWDLLSRMPGFFSRAFPICGCGDPRMAENIAKTGIWAFHGGVDATVNPESSRRMVRRLLDIGADIRYTEFPGVAHNSWEPAFCHAPLFDWIFPSTDKN